MYLKISSWEGFIGFTVLQKGSMAQKKKEILHLIKNSMRPDHICIIHHYVPGVLHKAW